jgi:hypothetical protein
MYLGFGNAPFNVLGYRRMAQPEPDVSDAQARHRIGIRDRRIEMVPVYGPVIRVDHP